MNVYELAKKYYPDLWSKARLSALVKAGKLTEEEYKEIVEGGDPDSDGGIDAVTEDEAR